MTETTFTIQNYHVRSKHQLDRYARGPETLDWDNQPDPFRTFHGSPVLKLPLVASEDMTPYHLLGQPDEIESQNLTITTIGKLMELSMALSAWKSYGPDRWSLRVNPSSGNLHPTECYLVLPMCPGIPAGVYHYNSYEHWLEQRCDMLNKRYQLDKLLGHGQFIIGFTSIHKRESWKYGERGYRYCQHDVGHAIAAIRYACAVLGWQVSLLSEPSDSQVSRLLGIDRESDFDRAEKESPDLLLRISINTTDISQIDISNIIELSTDCYWSGTANRLTNDNFYQWPIIKQAEAACIKPETASLNWTPELNDELPVCSEAHRATDIIRQRRSAQAYEANAPTLKLESFDRMLQCLLPRKSVPPFDSLPWSPRVHLVIFVHRVDGIKPGLYALPRSRAGKTILQNELRNEFLWQAVATLATPLYKLVAANAANSARKLACHQPIASDSAFSLAMLAEFDKSLEQAPWQYRQLFWEAGIIGQSLYLEAEAAGVRGTGIGCFFDDAVHDLLGINTTVLQDIYHFTVGQPRIDNRLQSEPPYKHLVSN